jgi:hypothetical protein
MKFEAVTADSVKRMAAWDVTLCRVNIEGILKKEQQLFPKALIPVYTAAHPRKLYVTFIAVRTANLQVCICIHAYRAYK